MSNIQFLCYINIQKEEVMAKDASFDIVSEFDKQELTNAIDQVKRELSTRFDLKDSNSKIELIEQKSIHITTNDEMKLKNIYDILQSKLVKRNLSLKILDPQKIENALAGNVKQEIKLRQGLEVELAKKIVGFIKDTKLKVQASIQGDSVRVTGKSRDDLQDVIKAIKAKEDEIDAPLQYTNYR